MQPLTWETNDGKRMTLELPIMAVTEVDDRRRKLAEDCLREAVARYNAETKFEDDYATWQDQEVENLLVQHSDSPILSVGELKNACAVAFNEGAKVDGGDPMEVLDRILRIYYKNRPMNDDGLFA
jgi:hypothetical protein